MPNPEMAVHFLRHERAAKCPEFHRGDLQFTYINNDSSATVTAELESTAPGGGRLHCEKLGSNQKISVRIGTSSSYLFKAYI